MRPDVTVPLWTGALRKSSRRDWGNLLAMLKQALPRHTASNDLLKKHISSLSLFSTLHLFSLHPSSRFFFYSLTPFFLIVLYIWFCSPKPLSLVLPSVCSFLLAAYTQRCVLYLWGHLTDLAYCNVDVILTSTHLPTPLPKMYLSHDLANF